MRKILFASLIATLSTPVYAQQKLSTQEYIEKYSDIAIDNMQEYNIPASITMAQAIIESGSGNSTLATKSNNHFGIKCKSEWTGATVTHDDDEAGECFRAYNSVADSYADHGEFLTTRGRYSALFDLDITDYAGWALGLKEAGYATNPQYPNLLIRTIEANKLYELDERAIYLASNPKSAEPVVERPKVEQATLAKEDDPNMYVGAKAVADDYNIKSTKGSMTVYINNNVAFVIAEKGDNFNSISRKTGKSVKKLVKYNDLDTAPQSVAENSIIYIAKKKSKAMNGFNYHTVADKETLHLISQKYGIKMSNLAKLNLYNVNYIVKPGQKMLLR